MCNLYDISPVSRLRTNFTALEHDISQLVEAIGKHYVAPAGEGVVVTGERIPRAMTWGYSRPWSASINNSRDDKLDSEMWSESWRDRRCLIPVLQFYEWSGEKGRKVKHAIRLQREEAAWFYIGGIWERSEKAVHGAVYSMITTAANGEMSRIHDRMPLILREDEIDSFLSGAMPEKLLTPYEGRLSFTPEVVEQLDLF